MELAKAFKALADESRFKLVNLLLTHDLCVGALAHHLQISEAAVSQHLKQLRKVGLVKGEKRRYWTHYTHPLSPTLSGKLEALPGVEKATVIEDKLRLYGKSLHGSVCQILNRLNAEGIGILSIQTLTPTLEDAFVKLTGVDAEVMRIDKPVKMGGPG